MNEKETQTTRRDFIKTTGALAAGMMVSGWTTSSARAIGANDRIRIGVIGVGGQGTHAHLRPLVAMSKSNGENIEVVAVCDVWQKRRDEAKAISGGEAFSDYRKLLEGNKVDAVVIAAPEHWHCRMFVEALEAGKHIYCEKPLSRYLDEAIKMYKTTLAHPKQAVQIGVQFCSDDKWRKANELIKAGKIGKVIWSQTSYCRNSKGGEWNYGIDPSANPDNLDWNMWLGSAPKIPFNRDHYFRWRKYWAYSGGITHDLFPHRLTPFMLAIGAEWPAKVQATGGIYVHKDRDVPDTINVLVEYPSAHNVFVAGSTCSEYGLPDLIRGHKGRMTIGGNEIKVIPERDYADEVEETTERAGGTGENVRVHQRNWLNAIRTGEKPFCDIELATKVMVALCMAEISYRENKAVRFDASKLEMTTA
jgi:predicted dehydrogenase